MTKFHTIKGYKTQFRMIKQGSGDKIVWWGKNATVNVWGVVRETGKKFWSTTDPGQKPIRYLAGAGQVMKGMDLGCLVMKVGEVRELIIPADEGCGPDGCEPLGIPPGSTLELMVEVLEIE